MTRQLAALRACAGPMYRDRVLTAVPSTRLQPTADAPLPPKSGARDLIVAVLESALLDLTDRRADATARQDAEQWINGAPAPLPFAAACEALGIDADRTRAALLDRDHPERSAVLFEIGRSLTAAG